MPTSKKTTAKKNVGPGKYVRSAETRKKLSEAAKRQAERAREAKVKATKEASTMKAPVAKRPLGAVTTTEAMKNLQVALRTIDSFKGTASKGVKLADEAQTTADGASRRSRLAHEKAEGAHERLDIHLDHINNLNAERKWMWLAIVVVLVVALVGWAL